MAEELSRLIVAHVGRRLIAVAKSAMNVWAKLGDGNMGKKKVKYNPFPESIGAESWLLFKARQMGWHVKVVPSARYVHLKPYGSYTVWTNGQSMYVNGYPFFIVLLRVLKNLVFGEGLRQLGMIGGFIQYAIRGESKLDTARFAYQFEVERLRRLISH